MSDTSDTIKILLNRQKVLADFGDFTLQSEDLDAVLQEVCRLVGEAMGTSRAKVLEIEPGGESLFVRAGVGWAPDVVGHVHVLMGENSSESFAIKAGVPVITQDISREDRFDLPAFLKDAGVVALANVPIFLPGKRAYGLLQVDDTVPRDFDEHDTEFLRTYAIILGPIIDRLFKVQELRTSEEHFRLTVEAATDYAIYITDDEDRITDWLPGAEAVFGWSAEEAVGQPGAIIFTPEDREAGQPEWEVETARREGCAPNVRWHLRKDGALVFIDGSVWALHDHSGAPAGFLKIGQDVTERRRADEQLRASEARSRALGELVPALLWQTDASGDQVTLNPRWLEHTGQTLEETQNGGWLDVVHPEDRKATERRVAEAYRSGEPLDLQFRIQGSDGDYRWFLVRKFPARDADGEVIQWFGAATDIHDLHQLQERQGILVAELQHRTRNLMAVVTSIAHQTMVRTGPTDAFREAFDHRLAALARVQGLLSRADQEPITIRALVKLELDALGAEEGERVRLDGPFVRIRPTIVQTLALAVHELATNARKYGALSDEEGHLVVEWHLKEVEGERRLHLEWLEDGISPSEPAEPSSAEGWGGYGRELIERALPYALDAQTSYELGPTQLRCMINLPLDRPGQARSN
ncbi:MAG TPA: PAS domain S-box protein [Rubellimicrobium sp.]|nr:PAS domain S-box protein [Rubellimicrobium sp.]